MNILIACEESQRVCIAFREKGLNAFSCDVQEPSGGYPEFHIQGDILPLLNGNCTFKILTGDLITIDRQWDLIISHPPCTYLKIEIQECLSKGMTFKSIAKRIGKIATTVSREVKGHLQAHTNSFVKTGCMSKKPSKHWTFSS